MDGAPLAQLRREIAETDGRILRDIARRLELARAVGRSKRAVGAPLRDYLVEREVVERWVDGLARERIPRDRAEVLVRWMLEEAVFAQETIVGAAPPVSAAAEIVVVGGLGQMGGWMRDYFRAAGHSVAVVDPRRPEGPVPFPVHADLADAVDGADVVVVATPMRAATAVYEELLARRVDATVFDILSIKAPLLPSIRRAIAAGLHVSSVHPLYGPGTRSLFGRSLLVLDCGDPAATDRVAALFARTALHVSRIALEDHDRLMADVLGLPHLVSLLFARTLERGGREPAELVRRGSTSFRRIAEVAQLVTRENPELVGDIQTLNPASPELFRRLHETLEELEVAVRSGDPDAYARVLARGRRFLDRAEGPEGRSAIPGP